MKEAAMNVSRTGCAGGHDSVAECFGGVYHDHDLETVGMPLDCRSCTRETIPKCGRPRGSLQRRRSSCDSVSSLAKHVDLVVLDNTERVDPELREVEDAGHEDSFAELCVEGR